jgi:hypothetical protein
MTRSCSDVDTSYCSKLHAPGVIQRFLRPGITRSRLNWSQYKRQRVGESPKSVHKVAPCTMYFKRSSVHNPVKQILLSGTLGVACTLVVGCVALGPIYTGTTSANSKLKKDVAANLRPLFQGTNRCGRIQSVDTFIDGRDRYGRIHERWIASGCQTSHVFYITFISSPHGGTDFAISLINPLK